MSDRRAKAPKSKAFQAKREFLAIAVAGGMPVRRAAKHVGVAYQTAQRWLAEPEMVTRVEELMGSTVKRARKRLFAIADAATECLAEAVAQGDVKAAIAVLDRVGLHARQTVEHATADDWSTKTLDELRAEAQRALADIATLEQGGGDHEPA